MSKSSLPKITNYSSPFQSLHNHLHSYSLTFPPNSRWTKQSFADECDINTIMSRYQSTGELPNLADNPQYFDATGMDFQDMQNKVVEAQSLFDALPSSIRNRFANNPAEFLSFVSDPSNKSELGKMGLLKASQTLEAPPSPEGGSGDSGKRSAPVEAEKA